MAFAFKPASIESGVELTTIGQEATHLTLILAGVVKVQRQQGDGLALVCEAGPGDVIGEGSLAEGTPSLVTTTAVEHCVVVQLPKADYKSNPQLLERYKSRDSEHSQLEEPRVAGGSNSTLDDFDTIAIIGSGAFASVGLVRHRQAGEVYVLKKMDREHLVSSNMQKQIIRERIALGYLHHPCIAKLYATFTSSKSLYMLLEPCLGGELYSYMREVHTLEEGPASFYTAWYAYTAQQHSSSTEAKHSAALSL